MKYTTPPKTKTTLIILFGSISALSAAPNEIGAYFQGYNNGHTYTANNFRSDFKDVRTIGKFGDGNQKIKIWPSNSNFKRLRINFRANKYGGDHLAGVGVNLAENNKYSIKYSARFEDNWQFIKGGKLPGIGGGSVPAAGKPNDKGMSIRIMWRRDNRQSPNGAKRDYLESYHYHLGQYRKHVESSNKPNATQSDKDRYRYGERTYLVPAQKNAWYHIKKQVKLNKGDGKGRLEIRVNNTTKYNKEHLYLANGKNWKMNRVMMVFFYGGNSSSWAPSQNTALLFDNFKVSRKDLNDPSF